jgi:hypothetical protein
MTHRVSREKEWPIEIAYAVTREDSCTISRLPRPGRA